MPPAAKRAKAGRGVHRGVATEVMEEWEDMEEAEAEAAAVHLTHSLCGECSPICCNNISWTTPWNQQGLPVRGDREANHWGKWAMTGPMAQPSIPTSDPPLPVCGLVYLTDEE